MSRVRPKIQIVEPRRCWVNEGRKVCYGSEEEALLAARAVEFDRGLPVGSLGVYRCENCGEWHLAREKK